MSKNSFGSQNWTLSSVSSIGKDRSLSMRHSNCHEITSLVQRRQFKFVEARSIGNYFDCGNSPIRDREAQHPQHVSTRRPDKPATCTWRIHKSRGDRRLVKAATVLPPPIRDKAHRLFAFVDTRFWRPSLQSGMTTIAVEIISEREKLRLQVGRGPE